MSRHPAPGLDAARAGISTCRATVVIPLHNHAEWIGELLESLFAQWRPDLALLIIDDASTDGSFAAAMAAMEARPDMPCMMLRNEHALHHDLVRQVVQFTTSDIIIKADSDDIALPGRLDALLAAFDADPSCRLVTSNAVLLDEDGRPIGIHSVEERDSVVDDPQHWAGLPWNGRWLGATMAFHRAVLTGFPPIDSELCPYGLDIVLPLRATLLGTHHYLARPLVGWRKHGRNTHRVAGVLDPRWAARERYSALHMMALAQRLRDGRHAKRAGMKPDQIDLAIARCQDSHFAWLDDWCRLRARLAASAPEEATTARVTPIPVIASLGPGRHAFGSDGPLGAVAATWSGFHPPEPGHSWTSGVAALLVLRTTPGVDRLVLTLSPQGCMGVQRAFVSVGFGSRVEILLSGEAPVDVELPVPDRWGADGIVLMIEAPDAHRLQDGEPETTDHRVFGVMLLSLELVAGAPPVEAGLPGD